MVRGEEPAAELTIDPLRALRVLGLPPGASANEIKSAWRDLAKVWHPDRFQHDERLRQKAGDNLGRINEAYESLRDYNPGVQPRLAARMRASVAMILGMGELGEPPPEPPRAADPARAGFAPTAPIGLRHSLRVLGLGTRRETGEAGTRRHAGALRPWVVAGVLALAVIVTLAVLLTTR